MNKKLLFYVLFLMTFNFATAQTIEIVGKGITGKSDANLTFSNLENIDSVVVGSVYKGKDYPTDADVTFTDSNEGPYSNLSIDDIIIKDRSNLVHKVGYFTGVFQNVDAQGVNVAVAQPEKVHSFYAFVHRNDPDANFKSYQNSQVSFFYQNGEADAYEYKIPINKASEARKVVVKMVISELDDGPRDMVIDIAAGSVTKHYEENTYNKEEALLLTNYVLEDVPGDVDHVTVSVYSPIGNGRNGDSFVVSSVVVDVEKVGKNCTSTVDYWKNHASDSDDYDGAWALLPNGESTPFFNSGKTYLDIVNNNSNSYYYNLARQYAAAELNILRGADASEIDAEFKKAGEILEKYTPRQIYYLVCHSYNRRYYRNYLYKLTKKLRNFNNGTTGPGSCDDDNDNDSCLTAEDVVVYPNPMKYYGKIEFTSKQNAKTAVAIYNSYGQYVCTLYKKNTKKGSKVTVKVSAYRFRNGVYYAKIWNGSCCVTKKVVIRCR